MRTPLLVKCATALTFFNTFVLIEEFIIDRHGLGQYIPLYRIGNFCTWDFVAVAAATAFVIAWHRRDNRRAASSTPL